MSGSDPDFYDQSPRYKDPADLAEGESIKEKPRRSSQTSNSYSGNVGNESSSFKPKTDEVVHPPVEVPASALNDDTLRALIEAFILREGTDYGREEVEHGVKIRQVMKQIDSGFVKIVFDPNTESVTLMNDPEWQKLSAKFF